MKEGEWKVFEQDVHIPAVHHNLHLIIKLKRDPRVGMRFKLTDVKMSEIVSGDLPDHLLDKTVVITTVGSHSWTHGHSLTIAIID